jgi:hypothetical protein
MAAIAALCLMVAPAGAAITLEAGEWRLTETGSEDGQPIAPEVTTLCMSAEEARDVVRALARLEDTAGQKCKTLHVRDEGNTLSFDMECGDAKSILIAVTMNMTFHTARHFSGTIRSAVSYGGKTVRSDKRIDSRWTGAACGKPPSAAQ